MKTNEGGRVGSIPPGVSMSVCWWCWCLRVQIFFDDWCATVVCPKNMVFEVPPSGAGSVSKLIISITCRLDMLLI